MLQQSRECGRARIRHLQPPAVDPLPYGVAVERLADPVGKVAVALVETRIVHRVLACVAVVADVVRAVACKAGLFAPDRVFPAP